MKLKLGKWTLYILATLWEWDHGDIKRRTFNDWQLVSLVNEVTDEEWSVNFGFSKMKAIIFRHHIPAYWWRM